MVDKAVFIIDNLLNTPYILWTKDTIGCGYQAYVSHDNIPDFDIIIENGINCVGLINLIRRYLSLEIPGLNENKLYAGGTFEWFKYLKKFKKLKKFNSKKIYPVGTLLIRNFKNEIDQGHVAVIYESNSKGILFSKVAHAYYNTKFDYDNKNKKLLPGLVIDDFVNDSHNWFEGGTYTHVCYPNKWLY